MTFIKNIIELLDPDLVIGAVSIGFFTTSIFIGKYIEKSKTVPIEPFDMRVKTLKEYLTFFRRQKKSLRKLTKNLILFEKEIKHLKLHRRHLRTYSWYWDEYIDLWRNFNDNRRRYWLIEKYIASVKYKSINYYINLSTVKYVLISQSETMQRLYLLKPTLPSVFEPLFFVLLVYFFIVHWKIARNIIIFLLTCNASIGVFLWKKYLYRAADSYKTTFCNMFYIIYISTKTFFYFWGGVLLSDWDGEIDPKYKPRKFKDPKGPIYPYNPLRFWF